MVVAEHDVAFVITLELDLATFIANDCDDCRHVIVTLAI
jgi:hypothetical protein